MITKKSLLFFQHLKMHYYIISFVSFLAAILLHPYITTLINQYVQTSYPYVNVGLPFIVSYLLAMLIIPEIGYQIVISMKKQGGQ